MNNNDIVRRLRYALNISDADMLKIFELGGKALTPVAYKTIMTKQEAETPRDQNLDNKTLEMFLNGLIISQRGVKKDETGQPVAPDYSIKSEADINNVAIKKIKIAMSYTSDDLKGFMQTAGHTISNAELSAVMRKPGQRNYKPAGDRYLRKLLQGMALEYHVADEGGQS